MHIHTYNRHICMYEYMYCARIHTYIHTYVHTYTHTYVHTYIHAYIHKYMIYIRTFLSAVL